MKLPRSPLPLPTNSGGGGGGKSHESRGREEGHKELPCLLTSCFVGGPGEEEESRQQDGVAAAAGGPVYFRIVHANQALLEYANLLPPSATPAAAPESNKSSVDENNSPHSRLLRGRELHRFLRLRDYSSSEAGHPSYDRCGATEASKSAAADPPHGGGGGGTAAGATGSSSSLPSPVHVAPCHDQMREGGRGLLSARASRGQSTNSKTSRVAVAAAAAAGAAARSQSWSVAGAVAAEGDVQHVVDSQEEELHQRMFRGLAQVCVSVCVRRGLGGGHKAVVERLCWFCSGGGA